jgi:hypothetical protein
MKTKLLLKAADIVEKVPDKEFRMGYLDACILGHCRWKPGFKKLNYDLDAKRDYVVAAARFFDISMHQASILFEPNFLNLGLNLGEEASPKEAAAWIREKVAEWKPKPITLPGRGMALLKKAIAEVQKTEPRYPTIKEEIERKVEMARNRMAADELLGTEPRRR